MAEPVQPLQQNSGNVLSNSLGGLRDEFVGKENVFAGVGKTLTGHNAYETEKVEPAYKLLTPEGMLSQSALPSLTAAQHQEVTRGTAAQQVTQDRFTYIDGNEKRLIKLTQREETDGEARLSWLSNRFLAIQGNEEHLTYGSLDTYVRGESTESFVGQHDVTAPEEFEWKQFERGFSVLKQDMMMAGVDLHMTNVAFSGIDGEFTGIKTDDHAYFHSVEEARTSVHALCTRIGGHLEATLHANEIISLGLDIPW